MTKSRKQWPTKQKVRRRQSLRARAIASRRHWLPVVKTAYAVVFAFVSWMTFLYTFKPRVGISTVEGLTRPGLPLSAAFQVTNDSTFSVYDVSLEVVYGGRIGTNHFAQLTGTTKPRFIPEIEPNTQPVQVVASRAVGYIDDLGETPDDMIYALVKVTFRPSFVWWRSKFVRRFAATRVQGGEFHWYETPVTN